MDLAGAPVRHLDRRARVVHERLLARPVDLAQHHINASAPLPVPVAETAVLIPVRVRLPVLQPQELKRHALVPRQLPVHPPPVRLWTPDPRRRRRRIQRRLQPRVVQLVRQRPGHPGLPRPPDVAADRAVGDPQNGRDLPVAPAESVLQPEYISNLAHGQPLPGHRLPPRSRIPREVGRTAPCIRSSSTPPHPFDSNAPASQDGRNDGASRWTICVGMGGRHPSERVDEMNRNQVLVVHVDDISIVDKDIGSSVGGNNEAEAFVE